MIKLAIKGLVMLRKPFIVGKLTNDEYPGRFEFSIKDTKHYHEITEAIEYWEKELDKEFL